MRPLDPWVDPQVQAALLAGFFLAAGWLVNGRANRRAAAALYADFMLVKIEAADLGADALAAIARYLDDVPAPEAVGMAEWVAKQRAAINTLRGSDPSAP